jgi:mannose-6-phosphate isomerase-like protein (cupin superfamily)
MAPFLWQSGTPLARMRADRIGERAMQLIRPHTFTGATAWAARSIAAIEGATVRLHWTDAPYRWHINDGPEVFVVLDGTVTMYVRRDGTEESFLLQPGDIFHAEAGDEHVAHPRGVARVLVIEKAGTI